MNQNSKSFGEDIKGQARLFKALGHPARLSILKYLSGINACMTGDIADELPLGRTTVNQHLKALSDAGLIVGNTEGVMRKYCLNPDMIEALGQMFHEFYHSIEVKNPNNCS